MASACRTEEVVNRATWTFEPNEYQLGLSVARATFRGLLGSRCESHVLWSQKPFEGVWVTWYQFENEKEKASLRMGRHWKEKKMKKRVNSDSNPKVRILCNTWRMLSVIAGIGLACCVGGCSKDPEPLVRTETFRLPGAAEPKLEMVYVEGAPKEYLIGKYEVTEWQWMAVMDRATPGYGENKNLPRLGVSCEDCQKFFVKLNALSKEKNWGWRFRLPTQQEWEYVCRAGATGDYCKLVNGDEITEETLDKVAWHRGNGKGTIHPVGEKKPNAFGLYDMHGNAAEWCMDRYAANSFGKSCQVQQRGGSYGSDSKDCRTSSPHLVTGTHRRFTDSGFRILAEK